MPRRIYGENVFDVICRGTSYPWKRSLDYGEKVRNIGASTNSLRRIMADRGMTMFNCQ
jgi:hypothetical protein